MKIKPIHIEAVLIWLFYSFVTKGSFVIAFSKSISNINIFVLNIFFGSFFGVIFLYFFSHEDFFKFAKEIENKNKRKEKDLEFKLLRYGKLFSSILITVLSGPLVGALAFRFLLPKFKNKYMAIGFFSAVSVTLWLGIARGIIPLRLPF